MELYLELENKTNAINKTLSQLKKLGKEKAKAERDYRIALAKEILVLRHATEGTKPVPVSIIGDMARGKEEIATLKLNRDIQESLYEAAREAIMIFKMEIRIIENQIEREWGQAKRV